MTDNQALDKQISEKLGLSDTLKWSTDSNLINGALANFSREQRIKYIEILWFFDVLEKLEPDFDFLENITFDAFELITTSSVNKAKALLLTLEKVRK